MSNGNSVAIMQPYFFPYLGYFKLIQSVDKFVVFDNVNFIKKGFINKNAILLNQQKHNIVLPIKNVSQNRFINQHVRMEETKKIKQTIEHAYKKSPEFNKVMPLVESCLSYGETNLAKYLSHQLQAICNYLKIDTQFLTASDIEQAPYSQGQSRIINICNLLSAKQYINAPGGVDLYDSNTFEQQGIDLKFIYSYSGEYKQFKQDFIDNLSIIDVLMFNSVNKIQTLLAKYELK